MPVVGQTESPPLPPSTRAAFSLFPWTMQLSSTNLYTRSVSLWVCCAVWFFTSPAAYADLTNDVATIADVMELFGSGTVGFMTYPRSPNGYNLSRYMWSGLFDGSGTDGTPSQSRSLLRQIRDRISTNDVSVSVTNSFDDSGLLSSLADTFGVVSHIDDSMDWMLGSLTYSGSMWHAHLDDQQFSRIETLLGNVVDACGDIYYGLGEGLNGVIDAVNNVYVDVDLTPVTDRQDAQYDRETYAITYGQSSATALDAEVAAAEAEDQYTINTTDHTTLEGYETEPDMPSYTPASDADTAYVNKDNLLDALRVDNVSHSTMLTLISAADFRSATGVDGSMVYNLAEGPVYTFIGDLSTICEASWYGLLAVMSALLFWRKQTEISGIVRATNFSRV